MTPKETRRIVVYSNDFRLGSSPFSHHFPSKNASPPARREWLAILSGGAAHGATADSNLEGAFWSITFGHELASLRKRKSNQGICPDRSKQIKRIIIDVAGLRSSRGVASLVFLNLLYEGDFLGVRLFACRDSNMQRNGVGI
jgi:hypothetical protein